MYINNKDFTKICVKEKGGFAMFEIISDLEKEQSPRRFYVVGIDHQNCRVYSAASSDHPQNGGLWTAGISCTGISYVASGRTRSATQRIFKKLSE